MERIPDGFVMCFPGSEFKNVNNFGKFFKKKRRPSLITHSRFLNSFSTFFLKDRTTENGLKRNNSVTHIFSEATK